MHRFTESAHRNRLQLSATIFCIALSVILQLFKLIHDNIKNDLIGSWVGNL
jgi:hypothetical protein